MSEYECPQCKRVYSGVQYSQNRFCIDCEKHLTPKFIIKVTSTLPTKEIEVKIEPIHVDKDYIVNIFTLYEEFLNIRDFNSAIWLSDRKEAYKEFQSRFSKQEIVSPNALSKTYRDFLSFRKNKSWTALQRFGIKALKHLDELRELIIFLQNESILIQERINKSLGEDYYVEGIGIGILTGLLHMFNPTKYGVWNSRTIDALEKMKRKPELTSDTGHSYLLVNKELQKLATELKTDLTTIDGLMWYVSKRIDLPKPQ